MNNENELTAALATIDKLRAERDLLAAENVGLKSFGGTLHEIKSSLVGGGHGHMAKADMQAQSAVMDVIFDAFDAIETPTTDRIVAEAEARGVEKAIAHLEKKFSNIGVQIMNLQWLADSLREGAGK